MCVERERDESEERGSEERKWQHSMAMVRIS